jgi:hypothetical protein
MFGHTNEPVTLTRDVNAVIIPVGEVVTLNEGTEGPFRPLRFRKTRQIKISKPSSGNS